MKRFAFLLILIGLFSGCTTAPRGATWWNPLTWGSGKEARQVEQAETEHDAAREAAIKAAQKAARETGGHLAVAPESRPVTNARESNGLALGLLDQVAGPLTTGETARINEQVAALNSENAAIRAEAERQRAIDRGHIADISARLGETTAQLASAQQDLAAGFERENALANQLRNANLIKWATTAGTLLMGALALAYKLNLGNLQSGVGEAIGELQSRYGGNDEGVVAAKHAIDAAVGRGQQLAIARVAGPLMARVVS